MANLLKALAPFVNVITTYTLQTQIDQNSIIAPLVGCSIQSNLEMLGDDFQKRVLSKREEARVNECFAMALLKIMDRLDKGDALRNDEFFIADYPDYSSGDKLLEAAFINSRNEVEKKKIKYIANLVGNILFTDHPFERSLHLLRTAEEINWRQFCQITLVSRKVIDIGQRPSKDEPVKIQGIDYRIDLYNLARLSVLKGPIPTRNTDIHSISEYSLDWIGERLFELMELEQIDQTELAKHT